MKLNVTTNCHRRLSLNVYLQDTRDKQL